MCDMCSDSDSDSAVQCIAVQCSVYCTVQCTLYSAVKTVQCSVHCTVQCTLYSAVCNVQCTVHCTVQCTPYSVVCTVQCSAHCTVQFTLYSAMYTVQCSVQCWMQCALYNAICTVHKTALSLAPPVPRPAWRGRAELCTPSGGDSASWLRTTGNRNTTVSSHRHCCNFWVSFQFSQRRYIEAYQTTPQSVRSHFLSPKSSVCCV